MCLLVGECIETCAVDPAHTGACNQSGVGAGLDVYEFQPDVPEALNALENVRLLPHLGTVALDMREAMGMMAVENLRAYFTGETPPYQVN